MASGTTLYDEGYYSGTGISGPGYTVTNLGTVATPINFNDSTGKLFDSTTASGSINFAAALYAGGTAGLTTSALCTATHQAKFGLETVCTATSDPRLKDISGPVSYGLNAIIQITPIEFTWNELGRKYNADDTSVHLGFNAANIKAVMPEVVGTEQHDGVDYLSLPHGTDGIVAALVNAVHEQQAEISALQLEVKELKAAK